MLCLNLEIARSLLIMHEKRTNKTAKIKSNEERIWMCPTLSNCITTTPNNSDGGCRLLPHAYREVTPNIYTRWRVRVYACTLQHGVLTHERVGFVQLLKQHHFVRCCEHCSIFWIFLASLRVVDTRPNCAMDSANSPGIIPFKKVGTSLIVDGQKFYKSGCLTQKGTQLYICSLKASLKCPHSVKTKMIDIRTPRFDR